MALSRGARERLKILWPALLKSFVWLIWNAFFGLGVLFPILLFTGIFKSTAELYKKLTFHHIGEKIFDEGILLFFCNALMAAAFIEYILSKVESGKSLTVLLSFSFMFSFLVTCMIFGTIYLFDSQNLNITVIQYYNFGLAWFTFYYCMLVKTIIYLQES